MSKVRLLFAPENTGFADKLASALAQSGYDASIDDDPASVALVIWSQASAASKPILSAARSALARRVLVPVALGKTPPPPSFEHLWPMDLAGWNGRPDDPRWKFVLDELELATRRGVVFRPAAANDRGSPPLTREAPPHAVAEAPPLRACAEDLTTEPAALFADEHVETIRPRPKFPRIAVGAGFGAAAIFGAGVAALMIGVSDGRRAAGEKDDPVVAFVVQPRPEAVAVAPETAAGALRPAEPAPSASADVLRDGAGAEAALEIPPADEMPYDVAPAAVAAAPAEATASTPAAALSEPPLASSDESEGADADPIAGLAWSVTASAEAETVSYGRYLRDCVNCPDLAEIDAGSFLMGAGDPAARAFEGPQTPVTLTKPIAMAVRETTFEDWARCVADGVARARPHAGFGRGKRPVINVTHADAETYAAWLSSKTGRRYRLPTEAEWEYAARAGGAGVFPFGPIIDASRANYDARAADSAGAPGQRRGVTAPAGAFAPNAFGLFDMQGNVWEWTADCWRASHNARPADASAVGGACASRAVKGGAWNTSASSLRPAHRDGVLVATARSDLGFRVVRDTY